MGTAGNIRNWSWVRDKPCSCGSRACREALRLAQDRREAIIEAQELLFDEPDRSASLARPLLLTAYEPVRLAS
jgi:hypothetical protein